MMVHAESCKSDVRALFGIRPIVAGAVGTVDRQLLTCGPSRVNLTDPEEQWQLTIRR